MQKLKVFLLLAVMIAALGAFNLPVQAADQVIDVTAKIDGDRFWQTFYTTAYGDEDTITLYKIKNVVVEIRSGVTVLDSFTFNPTSEQSHHFLLNTAQQNIIVQYRANTFADRSFPFFFDYKAGKTLTISNNPSQIVVKTPYLEYR
ncbi:MAG: hypothetical protein P4N59_18200 [Negativicutes bacterium]|nr:hypothetical protein [Negativicutes bacterium]